MTATDSPTRPDVHSSASRWIHRRTCIMAGGLAAVGGALALFVNPWFSVAAALGGLWLISASDTTGCGGP